MSGINSGPKKPDTYMNEAGLVIRASVSSSIRGHLKARLELSNTSNGLTERVLNDHPELFSEEALKELATMSDTMCIQAVMHWCDRLIQCESADMLHMLMEEALNDIRRYLKGDGRDYKRMQGVILLLVDNRMGQLEKNEEKAK